MRAYIRACRGVARRNPVRPTDVVCEYDVLNGHDGAADGSALTSWRDPSASRHLAQGTAGNRPVWKPCGTYGTPAVRFDGSNDVMSYTGTNPLNTTAKAGMVIVLSASNQTKYLFSAPDVAAGSNGYDCQIVNDEVRFHISTDAELQTSGVIGTHLTSTSMYVNSVDLAAAYEIAGVSSGTGFQYGLVNGTSIKGSSGHIAVGNFSDGGFSSPAAMDLSYAAIFKRPLSIGERRRMFRLGRRRWRSTLPCGVWRDGTISLVL